MPQKELITLPIGDIQPYAKNPRKNDIAVEDVKQSIIQCSYIAPIIIDENNEVIAGHTRLKAFKELGYKEIEVLQITGLTEQQKRKGRLLDNKAAEKAAWDFELLAWEIEDLDFEGFDFDFKFPDDEADPKEKEDISDSVPDVFQVVVVCKDEQEQQAVYERMTGEGYECRSLIL